MLLRLTYNRKSDPYITFSFISSPYAIRDLYWQLTHNYKAQDGTEIDKILVTNLDGVVIENVMYNPHSGATRMDNGD